MKYLLWEDIDTYFNLHHWYHQGQGMSHWTVRNCRLHYSAREIMQIEGPGHVFEQSEIIEPHPRWTPYNLVSLINLRVMPGFTFRNNIIYGNGLNKRNPGGPTILWEMYADHRQPGSPDAATEGALIEGNLWLNNHRSAISLGKGCTRMQNITIRNNVFMDVTAYRGAITLADAQKNLRIANNVFYRTDRTITFAGYQRCPGYLFGEDYASTAKVERNIFSASKDVLPSVLTSPKNPQDDVVIDRNLFYEAGQAYGTRAVEGRPPLFVDPEGLDFRLQLTSPAVIEGKDIGAYDTTLDAAQGMNWWTFSPDYFSRVPVVQLP